MEGEESLIGEANKGFNAKFNLDVLSNFKAIVYEVIKNPDIQAALGKFAAALAPFVLMQLNAKIELGFDDFAEIKDFAMMEPFLASFGQLLEGMVGSDVETMLSERIEIEEGQDIPAHLKLAIDFMHTLFDIFQEMHESGEMELNASFPNIASAKLNVTTMDLGKALILALKASVYDTKIKPKYDWIASQ